MIQRSRGTARRVAVGGLWHETNTFVNTRTTVADFEAHQLFEGEAILRRLEGTGTEIGGMIDAARRLGLELVPTLFACAVPSGIVAKETYESLLERLIRSLKAQMPVDGVLLSLHGAMVAEGYDDVEAHTARAVRSVVGPAVPISVSLDFHANISAGLAAAVDSIVGYDTYPHVDIRERGDEAAGILARILSGEVRPALAVAKPPLLPAVPAAATDAFPMRDLMAMAHEMERRDDVVAVMVAAGYPFSDVERAGFGAAVVTNGKPELARELADKLARAAWERRSRFVVRFAGPEEAVRRALELEGPVVLVDTGDNIGGGSPGDGTILLEALLRHRARRALVAIKDPEVVEEALRAGIGGTVRALLGGKTDRLHGDPVPVEGRVRLLSDGVFRHRGPYMPGKVMNMGRTAVIETGAESTLVVSERKCLPFDVNQMYSVGVDPAEYRIIVVKSAIAWRSAYGPFAKRVIEVDTPGGCPSNLSTLDYRRVKRPIFPLDPDEACEAVMNS